ncbi:hypothetical protein ACFYXF_51355 [Streptomyces sp. NPDC002680]|uniref:hypothetical protein n=1 Tax=Streptomyces sp. NPDC002680 TaxID=3364659 RepID=UPI0036C5EA8B
MTIPRIQTPLVMPSERLATRRQLDLVDVLFELGGSQRLPVSAQDLASRLDITPKTVSRTTTFLVHGGLLESGRGAWALTEIGHSLARLRSTDTARARLLLHDHWQDSWFHRRALERLTSGPVEEADLAAHLGSGLSATPERGAFLVEWMAYALLIDRDEQGRIVLPTRQQAGQQTASAPRPPAPAGPPGVLSPFLSMPAEAFSALPDAEFLALLQAYRTVFVKLTPSLQQSGN